MCLLQLQPAAVSVRVLTTVSMNLRMLEQTRSGLVLLSVVTLLGDEADAGWLALAAGYQGKGKLAPPLHGGLSVLGRRGVAAAGGAGRREAR